MTSEPTAKTTSAATSTGTRPAQVGDPADQRQHRDVPEQEAGDDRRGPLELVDRDADRGHHVRQRQHDDVGVGGGEGDGDGGQAEQHGAAARVMER